MAPERLGRAGSSLLADSLVSLGNSLEQTVVTRGNASPESAGPAMPQGVADCAPVGPTQMAFISRMSLRHHGFGAGAAGQKLLVLSPIKSPESVNFKGFSLGCCGIHEVFKMGTF